MYWAMLTRMKPLVDLVAIIPYGLCKVILYSCIMAMRYNDPIESSMIQFITPDQTATVSTTGVNGENNTSFPSGTPYVDTHATAYDLSYGFQTISFSAGSIHTTTAGNFFLRYTAPNDPAGNQGPTITRIVYIVNSPAFSLLGGIVTSPAGTLGSTITPTNPVHVNTFKIGTSTYAGVGGSNGLFIVDITDTESPEFVSRS